jgi:hypothetical protein
MLSLAAEIALTFCLMGATRVITGGMHEKYQESPQYWYMAPDSVSQTPKEVREKRKLLRKETRKQRKLRKS